MIHILNVLGTPPSECKTRRGACVPEAQSSEIRWTFGEDEGPMVLTHWPLKDGEQWFDALLAIGGQSRYPKDPNVRIERERRRKNYLYRALNT